MNDIALDIQENVICHCSGTTEKIIMELINGGFDNLNELSRKTGACSGCGACETSILELLAE
ncbi:MAG: (2Fe-2S)-binding protein [Methylobacter sp.]